MPKIRKPAAATEKQCWECKGYTIKVPGGAFCKTHKQFFPNQNNWATGERGTNGKFGTKPGLRTCPKFKVKIVDVLESVPLEPFFKKLILNQDQEGEK